MITQKIKINNKKNKNVWYQNKINLYVFLKKQKNIWYNYNLIFFFENLKKIYIII